MQNVDKLSGPNNNDDENAQGAMQLYRPHTNKQTQARGLWLTNLWWQLDLDIEHVVFTKVWLVSAPRHLEVN